VENYIQKQGIPKEETVKAVLIFDTLRLAAGSFIINSFLDLKIV
jgi:hypothetical protein